MLSAPTLVTGVGELVAEMRAGDTGKAEGGGRQQAGGGGGRGGEGRKKKGRCSSCRWPAPKPYQPIGSPGDTGTQRDPAALPTLPTRAALLLFFHFTAQRSSQTIFPAHFTRLVWERPVSGLRAYCGGVVWWVANDAKQPVLSDSLTLGPLILSKLGIVFKIPQSRKYDKNRKIASKF